MDSVRCFHTVHPQWVDHVGPMIAAPHRAPPSEKASHDGRIQRPISLSCRLHRRSLPMKIEGLPLGERSALISLSCCAARACA
jgi:hypothetical protein